MLSSSGSLGLFFLEIKDNNLGKAIDFDLFHLGRSPLTSSGVILIQVFDRIEA